MKVLMIGSDRKLFEPQSPVSERIREYGKFTEELHIVIMCSSAEGFKETQLSTNIWVYPTNSLMSIMRPIDAASLGKKIVLDKKFVRGDSLITAQDLESGWAGMKIKKKWRIPLEVQMHTDPFSSYFNGFQNFVRKMYIRKVLKMADTIRVVTEDLKNKIREFTSGEIYVLPIYIDKDRIENGVASYDIHVKYPWRFILLTVCRLAPEKNLSLALQVLKFARERFPDTGLVMVGSGPEEERLKSLAKKLGVEGSVGFAGWQENLTSFYKTANVFLQTSLFEGYGLALIEAGLSSLPVVTTNVGIAKELEHAKDAYIYPANRPDLFAQGVMDLLENNFKRENLKINLKRTLSAKLISKDEYLSILRKFWENTSKKVK